MDNLLFPITKKIYLLTALKCFKYKGLPRKRGRGREGRGSDRRGKSTCVTLSSPKYLGNYHF